MVSQALEDALGYFAQLLTLSCSYHVHETHALVYPDKDLVKLRVDIPVVRCPCEALR